MHVYRKGQRLNPEMYPNCYYLRTDFLNVSVIQNFSFCFIFVFETDLLETTYSTNGWHTLRVIRYKIKFQHTKKVKNTFDRNYFIYKNSLHTICIFLLDQELSSPFTKTKTTTTKKPDG